MPPISRTAGRGEISPDNRRAGMISVKGVATLLDCSARHVYRLADAEKMPRPRKIGSLVRWSLVEIETWIADGCPSCRGKK